MDDRDKVCTALQALGIQAEMSERGRPEERIYAGLANRSLGVIDIVEGPIRWVNCITAWFASVDMDSDMPEYLVYGVPDPKVQSGFPKVRVKAVAVRTLPIFGKVKRVRWKGNDFGLGIKEHLSQNVMEPIGLLESLHIGSFEIRAHLDRGCWTLIARDVLTPSKGEWDFYLSVASYLVETSLPTNT